MNQNLQNDFSLISKSLAYGDQIFIKGSDNNENYYLYGRSEYEPTIYFLAIESSLRICNIQGLVFTIYPKLYYEKHALHLQQKFRSNNTFIIQKKLDEDDMKNKEILDNYKGVLIKYGEEFQLYHEQSSCFLRGSRHYKLFLSKKNTQSNLFKCIPYLMIDKEGEYITMNERFYLCHSKYNTFLIYKNLTQAAFIERETKWKNYEKYDNNKKYESDINIIPSFQSISLSAINNEIKPPKPARIPSIPSIPKGDIEEISKENLDILEKYEQIIPKIAELSKIEFVSCPIEFVEFCKPQDSTYFSWGDCVQIKIFDQTTKLIGYLICNDNDLSVKKIEYENNNLNGDYYENLWWAKSIWQIIPKDDRLLGRNIDLETEEVELNIRHYISGRFLTKDLLLDESLTHIKISNFDDFLARNMIYMIRIANLTEKFLGCTSLLVPIKNKTDNSKTKQPIINHNGAPNESLLSYLSHKIHKPGMNYYSWMFDKIDKIKLHKIDECLSIIHPLICLNINDIDSIDIAHASLVNFQRILEEETLNNREFIKNLIGEIGIIDILVKAIIKFAHSLKPSQIDKKSIIKTIINLIGYLTYENKKTRIILEKYIRNLIGIEKKMQGYGLDMLLNQTFKANPEIDDEFLCELIEMLMHDQNYDINSLKILVTLCSNSANNIQKVQRRLYNRDDLLSQIFYTYSIDKSSHSINVSNPYHMDNSIKMTPQLYKDNQVFYQYQVYLILFACEISQLALEKFYPSDVLMNIFISLEYKPDIRSAAIQLYSQLYCENTQINQSFTSIQDPKLYEQKFPLDDEVTCTRVELAKSISKAVNLKNILDFVKSYIQTLISNFKEEEVDVISSTLKMLEKFILMDELFLEIINIQRLIPGLIDVKASLLRSYKGSKDHSILWLKDCFELIRIIDEKIQEKRVHKFIETNHEIKHYLMLKTLEKLTKLPKTFDMQKVLMNIRLNKEDILQESIGLYGYSGLIPYERMIDYMELFNETKIIEEVLNLFYENFNSNYIFLMKFEENFPYMEEAQTEKYKQLKLASIYLINIEKRIMIVPHYQIEILFMDAGNILKQINAIPNSLEKQLLLKKLDYVTIIGRLLNNPNIIYSRDFLLDFLQFIKDYARSNFDNQIQLAVNNIPILLLDLIDDIAFMSFDILDTLCEIYKDNYQLMLKGELFIEKYMQKMLYFLNNKTITIDFMHNLINFLKLDGKLITCGSIHIVKNRLLIEILPRLSQSGTFNFFHQYLIKREEEENTISISNTIGEIVVPDDITFMIELLNLMSFIINEDYSMAIEVREYLNIYLIKDLLLRSSKWYNLKEALAKYVNNVFLRMKKFDMRGINGISHIVKDIYLKELYEFQKNFYRESLFKNKKFISLRRIESVRKYYKRYVAIEILNSFKIYMKSNKIKAKGCNFLSKTILVECSKLINNIVLRINHILTSKPKVSKYTSLPNMVVTSESRLAYNKRKPEKKILTKKKKKILAMKNLKKLIKENIMKIQDYMSEYVKSTNKKQNEYDIDDNSKLLYFQKKLKVSDMFKEDILKNGLSLLQKCFNNIKAHNPSQFFNIMNKISYLFNENNVKIFTKDRLLSIMEAMLIYHEAIDQYIESNILQTLNRMMIMQNEKLEVVRVFKIFIENLNDNQINIYEIFMNEEFYYKIKDIVIENFKIFHTMEKDLKNTQRIEIVEFTRFTREIYLNNVIIIIELLISLNKFRPHFQLLMLKAGFLKSLGHIITDLIKFRTENESLICLKTIKLIVILTEGRSMPLKELFQDNRILEHTEDLLFETHIDIKIKLEIINLYRSIIELNDDESRNFLLKYISINSIFKQLIDYKLRSLESIEIYRLLCEINRYNCIYMYIREDDSNNIKNNIKLKKIMNYYQNNYVKCIEIVNNNQQSQYIYFLNTQYTKLLSIPTRNKFLQIIKRDSIVDKLIGLINFIPLFIEEIDYYMKLRTNIRRRIYNMLPIIRDINLILAFTVNFFMLFFYDLKHTHDILMLVQISFAALALLHWCIFQLPRELQWHKHVLLTESYKMVHGYKKVKLKFRDNMRIFLKLLLKTQAIFIILTLTFSLLGYLVSEVFLAFLLLNIVERSETLTNVLVALTVNWDSFLLTFLLMLIILYIWGVFGYFKVRDTFISHERTESHKSLCDSIWHCTLITIHLGFTSHSGIGGAIETPHFHDEEFAWRVIFDLGFNIIFLWILEHIIFGIVIETFAELRDHQRFKEYDERNRCFICNRESINFEKKGESFKKHITYEHNIWDYVDYIFYLYKKNKKDHTPIENIIWKKYLKNDISWFPISRTLNLDDAEVRNDRNTLLSIYQRLINLEANVSKDGKNNSYSE